MAAANSSGSGTCSSTSNNQKRNGNSNSSSRGGQHFKKLERRRPHSWHSSMGSHDRRRLHGNFIHTIRNKFLCLGVGF